MKKYKHTNLMSCATVLYDGDGKGHELMPNQSVILNKDCGWEGFIEVEEVKETRPNKKIYKESE